MLACLQVEGCDLSAANPVMLGGDGLLELSLGVPWQVRHSCGRVRCSAALGGEGHGAHFKSFEM